MKMLERVARALCVADGLDPDEDWRRTKLPTGGAIMLDVLDDDPRRWTKYQHKAIAALTAMRKPSEAMLDAALGGVSVAEG